MLLGVQARTVTLENSLEISQNIPSSLLLYSMAQPENGGSRDFQQLISDNGGAEHVFSRIVFTYKENNKTFKEMSGTEKKQYPMLSNPGPQWQTLCVLFISVSYIKFLTLVCLQWNSGVLEQATKQGKKQGERLS